MDCLTAISVFFTRFFLSFLQADKDKDDAAELKVDWIEPGLPRKLGNWERTRHGPFDSTPMWGRFDQVWLPARTMHPPGAYVW